MSSKTKGVAVASSSKVYRQTSSSSLKKGPSTGSSDKALTPHKSKTSFRRLTRKLTNANIVMKLGGSGKSKQPVTTTEPEDDEQKPEAMDLEMEFEVTMMPVLADCSRQKLRSFHMNLLKYGSNISERVTVKDTVAAFQESNIKLPGRALQLISEVYLDARGIDFQKLYQRLEAAQSQTGRDSVLARQLTGDRTHYNQMTEEARDADFLRRIEEQMVKCAHYFELNSFRSGCLELDISKTGKLSIDQMSGLAKDHSLPIYGALLTNLLRRCDDEKNGTVSWPEFMNFLTKSMETYASNNPDKPRLGSNKPKLEQGSVVSTSKRNSVVINQSGAHAHKTSFSKPSRGQRILQNLKNMEQTRTINGSPAETVVEASAPPLPTNNVVTTSEEESKIPTKEYIIKGQPVRLVIPADLEGSSQASIDPPQQRLKLDWVFGYNGKEVKNNLLVVNNGDVLYVVGHIAVLVNLQHEQRKQRHYREHSASITSISLHSDGIKLASSQSQYLLSPAHIRIWRSDNLQTVCVLEDKEYIVNSYTHLSFCVLQGQGLSSIDPKARALYSNQLLVSEHRDPIHISVWDIGAQSKIATASAATTKICSLGFNPAMALSIVTLGREHLQWWRLNRERGSLDLASEPNFGMGLKAKFYNCLHFTEGGDLITGDSNGTIYVWPLGANSPSNHIKHAHEGPVSVVRLIHKALLTGGMDGTLCLWKYGYHLDKILAKDLPSDCGYAKSVLHVTDKLLVGTTSNSILLYELQLNSHGMLRSIAFCSCPFAQGVAGDIVATIALSGAEYAKLFVCCGSSGAIVIYDTDRQAAVSSTVVQGVTLSSMAASSSGDRVVLGTQNGKVMILGSKEEVLETSAVVGVSKSRIEIVSLSPQATRMSAVCNSTVYILEEKDGEEINEKVWTLSGKFKVDLSRGPISYIDWSMELIDGCHLLRVFCNASLNTSLWNPKTMSCVQSIEPLYSCSWSTQKFPLTYSIAGVWYSKQCVEDGLQCIDINNSRELVALCSKQGYLCLFRHPCTASGAFCHTYKCHIQPRDVLFTRNNLVLTSGMADSCVMQWKIV